MCGIVGYLGYRDAYPILIKGLKRLEYRGYDSAGVAIHNGHNIHYYKKKGKVSDLEQISSNNPHDGRMGIAHTRWATHGEPSDINSHPHTSMSGNLFLIHNGIIENFHSIKEALSARGFKFKSDTDTEVLVNLIEDIQKGENTTLENAVRQALNQVIGAYAICVFDKREPNEIIVAKMGSPLVIGLAEDEYFIASDATPFLEYTKKVIYLQDGEMGVIRKGKPLVIREIKTNLTIDPYVQQLQMDIEQIEKGGFEHFMLKEIYEQPRSVRDTLRGRLLPEQGLINMRGIDEYKEKFLNAQRIIIVGCGTSWHAGLVGEYLIEDIVRMPVEVEYASEFRYRNPIITEKDVVIAISQSGETADTLAAVKLAKSMGATIFGICNVVGSSIARETHAGAYTHAGPEIGVASTKAFTAQITVLALIALKLGYMKGSISESKYMRLLIELNSIPEKIEETLKCDPLTRYLAEIYKDSSNALYLGRGYNFPVALEGALKLKEISYIHAEGYPAAEMKHGPIALIDENMPVIVIAPKNDQYDKIYSNVQEVKARKGRVLAVVNHDDEDISSIADHIIEVPETENIYSPIINTIPLQLLSYHIALMRGCNVDQPRNLAKSVTVE
ncbi:glutamine--fructose-6-phosphate transaminase (isomerizing) [Schleiferia thermophila]|jgi:glucosamine--fructose-6-phosphate aminotransferase (isomerizing)|uniref:Glutamine--fructose-6-phosphate aminotransferase [isomerizing] n=1 Tax=Schleiferia thermophila TaxID=884107 RepID=A0A369A3V4_9FLAO|nr:glutamine--fructose-6-phosphate transaminase (isomerizing) [Schleiferia thermophila]PMB25709.1 glutamine--fructose-6-phosphate transaminase (isomerizing) [Fischerella thermalis CCMEE 5319]RCX03841.1 glucosamine--fructose-6-phosphate aminotransferase (isomerizing) [Schleiferia thermophila]GCD80073.1 glutamine--fructose-6-phosphate aminotransferase [isomerizing] [Schleiferia thermophila]